ncbi:MAG: hypothetical protein DI551_10540 [Micavibrio aeruginosavorus]|uniref:Uncharacterized protein n=1 Tax=Micavibrio aeruginosavorus TaxID=349221 RepID=A0A2W5MSL2_9BACT|nr:MAG: hypothetical protein DI551_10540 [Micavibrio aeruginosavorus]
MVICQRKKGPDVSAAIKNSLNNLSSSIVKLEKAIETKKATPASKSSSQNDLFSAPSQQGGTLNPANVRMLATRLDNAINQVEQILKEGRG